MTATAETVAEEIVDATPVKRNVLWLNVFSLAVIHLLALYGFIFVVPFVKWQTFLWGVTKLFFDGFGVTGGAHRLWTHKAYKAKTPLRILLMSFYLSAGMNSMFDWVRDHRIHHKFSETDADPHNAKRGLFFSHMGWLMQKKHPEVLRRGRQVDMSDILADPVVQFQQKYFKQLVVLVAFVIPISIPCIFWDETLWNSTFCTLAKWVFSLNCVWSVNSFAHIYGTHPYNSDINPAENSVVSFFALGEGWHNYHHTFPWDYKTAELGDYGFNLTTAFIDFFAYIGWAYDLRQPSRNLIQKTVEQIGDGTHLNWSHIKEVDENGVVLLKTEEKVKGI